MKIINTLRSSDDDTIKYQFILDDSKIIEACVIFFWEETAKINICVSTQVGCVCKCDFCVTGHKRFVRNLSKEEILEQVNGILHINPKCSELPFEVTYMGTGDPFFNIINVMHSAYELYEQHNNLIRINISTAYPVTSVDNKLILESGLPLHFQYSLHFVSDEKRKVYLYNSLLPIKEALERLDIIAQKTQEPFCVNYLLFSGINDSTDDADKLVELTENLHAYLKISKYCPIPNSKLVPSRCFDEFTNRLSLKGAKWKTFESKGVDIHASCGHLLSDVDF